MPHLYMFYNIYIIFNKQVQNEYTHAEDVWLLNTIQKYGNNCSKASVAHEMNPDFRHVLFEMCGT